MGETQDCGEEGRVASGRRLMKAGVVLLSRAEVQSGSDRQSWAEGLILQLPETHDGRNSWLINYGVSAEAIAKRERWNERAVKNGRSPDCTFNGLTRSTGSPAFTPTPSTQPES